ncbi:hypothetical protein WEH80_22710 [Actinomycetes bacterium KLBMP 9759]
MTGGRDAPRIDVERLPADVQAFIEALDPGGELVVTRAGRVIATITRPFPAADEPPREAYDEVTVVATAMRLSAAARASLSAELGPGYIVIDMNEAPETADVLLVPPVSPQLIGNLRTRFQKARVVVAELDDPELGVSFSGPVRRLLDAGAETYLSSTTVPRLAKQLDRVVTERQAITGGPTVRREITG